MRLLLAFTLGLLACARPPVYVTAGIDLVRAEPSVLHRWSFDPAPHFYGGPSPIEESVARERFLAVYGRWSIGEDTTAPSAPYVLEQAASSKEPARILVERVGFRFASVRARCKTTASCGVIFNAQNEDDYYVARVDSQAVRLVHMVGLVELELVQSSVKKNDWSSISVWTRDGDTFISLDGEVVASSLHDEALAKAPLGRIGLWANGPAEFDDLSAMELPGKE